MSVSVPPSTEPVGSIPVRLHRVAGGFALAHVLLLFAGLSQQAPVAMSEGPAEVEEVYGGADLARVFTGGLLELLGFLCLLVALVFVARAVGRRNETGSWAAQVGLMGGVGYIACTFATGMPAGAAAMYALQHGAGIDAVYAVNNVRLFSYFLSLSLLGVSALGIAVSALSDRFSPRWLGWGGAVTGIALLAAPALASIGQQDLPTLVWLAWWVGVAVTLLRHSGTPVEGNTQTPTRLMRHA